MKAIKSLVLILCILTTGFTNASALESIDFGLFSPGGLLDINAGQTKRMCIHFGGKILDKWTCPNSKVVRAGVFCEVTGAQGKKQVFNGCTGTVAGVGSVFHKACVLHDFCYHNEPAANGKSKSDCDDKFYNDMISICEKNGSGVICQTEAYSFYELVANFGDESWECAKENVHYPASLDFAP